MECEKPKQFRMDEVKQKNDSKNTYIVIHNSVYNVTEFLNEHPGGEEVLLEQGGQDASEAFEDVGHSSEAREMMKKYHVGELVEEDRRDTQPKKPPSWNTSGSSEGSNGSWKSWLIPVILGIVATMIYRFFLFKQ